MKPHQGAPPLTLVGDYGDDDYVDDDVYGDLDMQVFIKDRETSSRSSTLAIGTEHWRVATTVSTAALREFSCTHFLREFFLQTLEGIYLHKFERIYWQTILQRVYLQTFLERVYLQTFERFNCKQLREFICTNFFDQKF